MKQLLRKTVLVLVMGLMLGGVAEAKRKAKPMTAAKPPVQAVVAPIQKPAPVVAAPAGSVADLNQRWLAAHNRERAAVGVPALAWSEALARDAAIWATHQAKTKSFEHAPLRTGKDDQGENLWMGTKGAFSAEEMIASWIDERKMFKRGRFPTVSTSGNWLDVGHYTQLIWRNTTMIGCAIAANAEDEYLVCRYSPPGNWTGQDPFGDKK